MAFSIKENVVIVEAAHLKRPWSVNVKYCDHIPFFSMSYTCYGFAAAMGLRITGTDAAKNPRPWKYFENSFLKYMTLLRDTAVDKMIIDHFRSDDPAADNEDVTPALAKSASRSALYHDAKIPQVVNVVYPGYIADDGARIADHEFKCFSTPCRKRVVTVALNVENMNFMHAACNNSEHRRSIVFTAYDECDDEEGEDEETDIPDLPEITQPNVKWMHKKLCGRSAHAKEWRLCTTWRDAAGKFKTKSAKVNGLETAFGKGQLEQAEKYLQSVYDSSNVEKPNIGPYEVPSNGAVAGS